MMIEEIEKRMASLKTAINNRSTSKHIKEQKTRELLKLQEEYIKLVDKVYVARPVKNSTNNFCDIYGRASE